MSQQLAAENIDALSDRWASFAAEMFELSVKTDDLFRSIHIDPSGPDDAQVANRHATVIERMSELVARVGELAQCIGVKPQEEWPELVVNCRAN